MDGIYNKRLKVLFVGHEATRTGAPIMLLNFLKYIKIKDIIDFQILLNKNGSLEKDFSEITKVKYYRLRKKYLLWFVKFIKIENNIQKIINHFLVKYYKKEKIDLIYSNTIVNGEIIEVLSSLNLPIITHIHELNSVIQYYGESNWEKVKKNTFHFISASSAVKDNLVIHRGINKGIISVVHSFVNSNHSVDINLSRDKIKLQLKIPSNSFVVCGSGVCGWRKGTDIFVRMAKNALNKNAGRNLYFIWVGKYYAEGKEKDDIEKFIKISGLEDFITFTGEVDDPLAYFAASDVFAMVSREDPFPLVCLEAASLGRPLLCFDGTGGIPEFVEKDAGFVVPFLDINCMAEKIIELSENYEMLKRFSYCAKRKVSNRHDILVGSERIIKIVYDVYSNYN